MTPEQRAAAWSATRILALIIGGTLGIAVAPAVWVALVMRWPGPTLAGTVIAVVAGTFGQLWWAFYQVELESRRGPR